MKLCSSKVKQPSISSDHDGEHVVAQSNVLFVPHTLVHTHHQILSSICAVVFREPLTHHQTTLSTSQGTSSSPEPSSYDTGRVSMIWFWWFSTLLGFSVTQTNSHIMSFPPNRYELFKLSDLNKSFWHVMWFLAGFRGELNLTNVFLVGSFAF